MLTISWFIFPTFTLFAINLNRIIGVLVARCVFNAKFIIMILAIRVLGQRDRVFDKITSSWRLIKTPLSLQIAQLIGHHKSRVVLEARIVIHVWFRVLTYLNLVANILDLCRLLFLLPAHDDWSVLFVQNRAMYFESRFLLWLATAYYCWRHAF